MIGGGRWQIFHFCMPSYWADLEFFIFMFRIKWVVSSTIEELLKNWMFYISNKELRKFWRTIPLDHLEREDPELFRRKASSRCHKTTMFYVM